MIRILLSVLIFLLSLPALAIDNEYVSFFNSTGKHLVIDYRLPISSDMKQAWKAKDSYTYKTKDSSGNYKAPYWTSGDFNGDQKIDYAYILVSRSSNENQLIVFISSEIDYIAIKLGNSHNYEMGVATQIPEVLTTASGKGYWPPTSDDPPQVTIKRHAISYFMFESAASVFIWDDNKKTFKRHWTSD